MTKPLVVVFARRPGYGAVKTRLARDIGNGEALRFYRNTLTRIVWKFANDRRFETVLAVTPDRATVEPIWPAGVCAIGQGAGDLGRRMTRALTSAGARPAVVIGSDIPDIEPGHAAAAFRALASKPFVLGPARDGGYWLIGARHPFLALERVLDGVRWSSAATMADTIARLGEVAVLPHVLDDVDDGDAYRRFVARTR